METLTINAHDPGAFAWETNMLASRVSSTSAAPRSSTTSNNRRDSTSADLPSRSAREEQNEQSFLAPSAETGPGRSPSLQPQRQQQQQPTPAADPDLSTTSSSSVSPESLRPADSTPGSPLRIRVKSLQHIQSFGSEDLEKIACSHSPSNASLSESADQLPQYEISDMPVNDVIEMVAGLLTKITATNDHQHERMHAHIPSPDSHSGLSHNATSVLSFHGKNVPSITILSYLTRIQKYCPATYEVFLSLLVYFDRMTEKVNAGPMQTLQKANHDRTEHNMSEAARAAAKDPSDIGRGEGAGPTPTPPSSGPGRTPALVQDQPTPPSPPLSDSDSYSLSQFFVVDSFNIHRLVIAGVTCASKFFSDVFYTNSRYAKVGGLPLPELNHLELQFLILNDFRLSVSVEELEAYATMLVAFYAREIVSQRKETTMKDIHNAPAAETDSP